MSPLYTKFKTPFFQIYVGDSRGKQMIRLPHHIERLVEKIEIQEVLEEKHNLVNITFVEGSREPANQDPSAKNKGLYPLDAEIAGALTNRAGILTDLIFGGNGKITFFDQAEQISSKSSAKVKKQAKQIKNKKATQSAARPRFLFQEHNRLKIVWGYLEDPKTQRAMVTNIKIVQTEFLDNSATMTIITGESPLSTWSQIAPAKGVSFYKTLKIKNNKEFDDLPIKDFVESFCKKMGLTSIVSERFAVTKVDKGKVKQIPGGMSLKQFFDRLAKQYNAYWNVVINPFDGKETLYFIEKSELESGLIHAEDESNLFSYKNPQSIVRSIKVMVDFGGVTDTASQTQKTATTPTKTTSVEAFSAKEKTSKPVNNASPTTSGDNAKNVLGDGNITNKSVESPLENSPENVEAQKKMREADARKRLVGLTLETIGYTRLIPGMIKISGIGLRYSGKYRVISVKHTIDASGYFTTAQCTSQFLSAGGVQPAPVAKTEESKTKVPAFAPQDQKNVKTGPAKPSAEEKRQGVFMRPARSSVASGEY